MDFNDGKGRLALPDPDQLEASIRSLPAVEKEEQLLAWVRDLNEQRKAHGRRLEEWNASDHDARELLHLALAALRRLSTTRQLGPAEEWAPALLEANETILTLTRFLRL